MSRNKKIVILIVVLFVILLLSACGPAPSAPTATLNPTRTPQPTRPTRTPTVSPPPTATLLPSSTPLPTFTLAPSLTPIPTDTPTPAVFGIDVPFGPLRDDFSDPGSGWVEAKGEDYGFGYQSGAYNMYVDVVNWEVCSSRTRSHSDIVIEVDVTKNEGTDNAYFGITCRKNSGTYYSLAITGSGEYRIYRTDGKQRNLLDSGPSSVIKKGNATNHLEARCIDTSLTLLVNVAS